MKRMNVTEKPEVCPSCGFMPVGTILYGTPVYTRQLQNEIIEGTTIIGGCCGGTNLPRWACKNCGCEFMLALEEVEKIK